MLKTSFQKIIFLTVFSLILSQSCIKADPYFLHTLKQTSSEGHWITLSDGSMWEVLQNCDKVQNWHIDDPIGLDVKFHFLSHEYVMHNLKCIEKVQVQNFNQEPPQESFLHEIKLVGHCGTTLQIDDGSIWRIEMNWLDTWRRAIYWQAGERISIFATPQENKYILISQNHSPNFNTFFAKRICYDRQHIRYRHVISEISPDGATIKIDNGYEFSVPRVNFVTDATFNNNKMRNIVRGWNVGDEIVLHVRYGGSNDNIPYYDMMINLHTLEKIRFTYCKQEPTPNCPRILEIDPKGKYVTLDDGSTWKLNLLNCPKWKVGQCVRPLNMWVEISNYKILVNLEDGDGKKPKTGILSN